MYYGCDFDFDDDNNYDGFNVEFDVDCGVVCFFVFLLIGTIMGHAQSDLSSSPNPSKSHLPNYTQFHVYANFYPEPKPAELQEFSIHLLPVVLCSVQLKYVISSLGYPIKII